MAFPRRKSTLTMLGPPKSKLTKETPVVQAIMSLRAQGCKVHARTRQRRYRSGRVIEYILELDCPKLPKEWSKAFRDFAHTYVD